MTIAERIQKGEAAIAKAKAEGISVRDWEAHLEGLRRQLFTPDAELPRSRILAVEICSNILQSHVWLGLDPSFDPGDAQAVYYVDELTFLATKDPRTLREIHNVKLAFGPGTRVRGGGKYRSAQQGAET
jgi:hypothetical protein